jgi:hypothetical protein
MYHPMISGVGSASAGIGAQIQRFERSAARVAGGDSNYVRETVEQMSVEHAVKANVAVIKTADEMVGTLLDIFV